MKKFDLEKAKAGAPIMTKNGRKARRIVKGAKLYPNEYLADFRAHFNDVWLYKRAYEYFSKKDKTALPFLQKMILQLSKAEQEQIRMLPNKDFEEF